MRHFGLLITKDDDALVANWLAECSHYFDEIVCLDGSTSEVTREACRRVPNVCYVHETDLYLPFKTDHGLRWGAHRILVDRHGYRGWVTLCHVDEFFYHDPRKCCRRADEEGCDGLSWFAVHFLPHPEDASRLEQLLREPPQRRFRHYHWGPAGSNSPWREFRSFRNDPTVCWDLPVHGSTEPRGLRRHAPFVPTYRHLKVYDLDTDRYRNDGDRAVFRNHWAQSEAKTGVPFRVNAPQDLLVAGYPPYRRCDVFDGVFDHDWNIGEQYR